MNVLNQLYPYLILIKSYMTPPSLDRWKELLVQVSGIKVGFGVSFYVLS